MSAFTKTEKSFIEHEVKIRLHDEKFKLIEKRFDNLDTKLNLIIGIVIGSVLLPVGLHFLQLI